MCIRQTWNWIDISGTRYRQTNTIVTCDPPCRRPRVVYLNDQYQTRSGPAQTSTMVPRGQVVERVYRRVPQQPRGREPRKDLRLEFNWHIPFTRRRSPTRRVIIEEIEEPAPALRPVFVMPIHPPTPPRSPIRRHEDPLVISIAPTREHQPARPRPPPRERSNSRLDRARAEERRILRERQEALDARIEDLRAQERARRAAREDAIRTSAHEARIREIDAQIADLETQLRRSRTHRRRAEGPILHQDERPRYNDDARDYRADFRSRHQDAGGGTGAGEAGLGGGRYGRERAYERARDREIRDLERRLAEGRARRRRLEALGRDPGTRFWEPARDDDFEGIRINNRNGRGRM